MKSTFKITISLLAAATFVLAQDTAPVQDPGVQAQSGQSQAQGPAPSSGSTSGWKRVGDTGGNFGSAPAPDPGQAPAPEPAPPAQLTLKQGTFITVRINQALSSDRNQVGDAFTATLIRPIVVDGFVVAQPGQTLAGRVAEAIKAGRASGVSHLGVQLTDLTLVDGQQIPLQSELITRNGPTSVGRDAAAIGTTTGVGAAVGAAAAGGPGAAIGAGAGAVASTIGVLLTRGHPTVITPESVLTFRIDAAINIATDHAPQAFRPVGPNEYNSQPQMQAGRPGGYAPAPAGAYYAGSPYAYAYPYGYPYYGYPYGFYGPTIGIGFYGGGFYGGRFGGFRGRR
ncbi:MAG TPA: hypothetical protein VGG72_20150 [Bryobacteraceae bacterium]